MSQACRQSQCKSLMLGLQSVRSAGISFTEDCLWLNADGEQHMKRLFNSLHILTIRNIQSKLLVYRIRHFSRSQFHDTLPNHIIPATEI